MLPQRVRALQSLRACSLSMIGGRFLSTTVNAAPPGFLRGSFDVKRPGTEGNRAQKVPWPISDRNKFFASQTDDDEVTKNAKALGRRETAREAMNTLVTDLKEMRLQNPGMSIEEKGKEIVLRLTDRPDVSLFRIVVKSDDELGFETSSSPGVMRVYKRNEFGEWNCVDDGHNMHGLFVRDILPYLKGLPRFAIM